MSGVRLSKTHSVFAPSYVEAKWHRFYRAIAKRSRRIRAFVFGLPPSRLKVGLVARFFEGTFDDMEHGRFEHFKSFIHPDAPINLFGLGTYHGPDGWQTAL